MFYHYRPTEDADNKELPPLSTGRVARATSDDGLTWTQKTDGIDAGGSTVAANTEDWYWFDSGHVGCGAAVAGGDAYFLYTYRRPGRKSKRRRRLGHSVKTSRSAAATEDSPWRRVAARPRPRRGQSVETSRSVAATEDSPWRRVAASPRLRTVGGDKHRGRRGQSVETSRRRE